MYTAEQVFIEYLTGHKRTVKSALRMQYESEVTLLGKPKHKMLARSHYVALHSVGESVDQGVVAYYD